MSKIRRTLARLLAQPSVYLGVTRSLAARDAFERLVRDHLRPTAGHRVLDLGCGPADILDHLGNVEYVGLDENPLYLEAARSRYGERCRFFVYRVGDPLPEGIGRFDLVLALGILHHLDDLQAVEVFRFGRSLLRGTGRMVTMDPSIVEGQSPVARCLMALDRGRYVREPRRYEEIAARVFTDVHSTVRHDLLFLPYTHCILECR